jgi:hypothetical protein
MLFNLSRQRHFTSTGEGGEISCYSRVGPYYGKGELFTCSDPFNGDEKCMSYANQPYYKIKKEGGKNMLTNEWDGYFTITELEVWSIKEVVRNNKILIDIERMITLRETQRKSQRMNIRDRKEREKETAKKGHRDRDSSTYDRTNLSKLIHSSIFI